MNTAKLQKCHIFKHITRGVGGSKSIRKRSNCWEYRFCVQFIFHIFAVNVRKLFVYIYISGGLLLSLVCFSWYSPLLNFISLFFWHTFTRQILRSPPHIFIKAVHKIISRISCIILKSGWGSLCFCWCMGCRKIHPKQTKKIFIRCFFCFHEQYSTIKHDLY